MNKVKFDVSKRIDLRSQVENEMRVKKHDAGYTLPTAMTPQMQCVMEQYYECNSDFINIDDVDFFNDAQRIRIGILSDAVLKNMSANFDVNKYSRPIDIIKYRHNGKTYNVCVDGQGRCAFAYINGIRKMRCNVIGKTDDWDEVCRIPMNINDKSNYQGASNEQKFEMLLNQGRSEAVKRYSYLKSIFTKVILPCEKKAGKMKNPEGTFGTSVDWTNYLWRVKFTDDGMMVERGNVDPDVAVKCYSIITEKFNNSKGYPNWYRTFNAINRFLKRNNNNNGTNFTLTDLFDANAENVDKNRFDSIDYNRFNYLFINGRRISEVDLGIMLLKLCKKYGVIKFEHRSKKKFSIFGKSRIDAIISDMEQFSKI